MQIWPPKSVKDSGSRLHTKLKEAIMLVIVLLVASKYLFFLWAIYLLGYSCFVMIMEVLLFAS